MGELRSNVVPLHGKPANCTRDDRDTVERPGLIHDWRLVTSDANGDIYQCRRCRCMDSD